MEKLKHNARVRDRVNFVRSVQQGLCSIDDVDDYGLADYGDELGAMQYEDVGDETGEAMKARLAHPLHLLHLLYLLYFTLHCVLHLLHPTPP